MKISLLINMKMQTLIGIFIFISREIFMLSSVEHEKSFITSGPDLSFHCLLEEASDLWLVRLFKEFTVKTLIRLHVCACLEYSLGVHAIRYISLFAGSICMFVFFLFFSLCLIINVLFSSCFKHVFLIIIFRTFLPPRMYCLLS